MISDKQFKDHMDRLRQMTDEETVRYLRHLSVHLAEIADGDEWDYALKRFEVKERFFNETNPTP